MAKFLTILLILLVSLSDVFSQKINPSNFQSPLDIPLILSGNFGELRSTHFHAGIDIKTQGVSGKPVYAANVGYISRIKIQSGGYGRSLYITHPNGYTTVYAHLDRFTPKVESYVINSQYNQKSYEIELFPKQEMFLLKKGEIIGYSGNTGRSSGPHLHFEIRKTNGQIPVNGLRFHLPIKDNVRPEFKTFYAYSYPTEVPVSMGGSERKMYSVKKKNDSVYVVDQIVEGFDNYLGFGVEVYDFLNGSSNKCGIYILQLKIEDIPLFMFQIDAISFANSRFVNAHMDYELKTDQGKSVHRLFALPNNTLPIYSYAPERGLLYLADDSLLHGEIVALDAYGNSSSLLFTCKRIGRWNTIISPSDNTILISWKKGGFFSIDNYSVYIPPKALYQDIYFSVEKRKGTGYFYTDTLVVHKPTEPLHLGITIKAEIESVPEKFEKKLLFASVNGMGKLTAEGGDYYNGELTLNTRKFGKYIITIDTLPPVLKPVLFQPGAKYNAEQTITFQTEDDLTGIQSYNAYIDEKWVLLKYDAKSGTLSYTIDTERLEKGKSHHLKVIVTDMKNNQTFYDSKFEF